MVRAACDTELPGSRVSITSIRQIAPNQLEDVAEFFRVYKNLEGRVTVIGGWRDADAVAPLLESCIRAAQA